MQTHIRGENNREIEVDVDFKKGEWVGRNVLPSSCSEWTVERAVYTDTWEAAELNEDQTADVINYFREEFDEC
jgi:hypothetical protein